MAKTYKRLVLPEALGVYAYIWEPRPKKKGEEDKKEEKYGITLLWDKTAEGRAPPELRALQDAIVEAATSEFGKDKDGNPVDVVDRLRRGLLHNPLGDGDVQHPDDKLFKGRVYVNCNSRVQPEIVDRKVQPVLDQKAAYAGCFFRASVAVHAFENSGKRGVSVALNNLQVTRTGPRMDGRKSATEDFKEVDGPAGAPAGVKAPTGANLL